MSLVWSRILQFVYDATGRVFVEILPQPTSWLKTPTGRAVAWLELSQQHDKHIVYVGYCRHLSLGAFLILRKSAWIFRLDMSTRPVECVKGRGRGGKGLSQLVVARARRRRHKSQLGLALYEDLNPKKR